MGGCETDLLPNQSVAESTAATFTRNRLWIDAEMFGDLILGIRLW
jgi:hypothetical protein